MRAGRSPRARRRRSSRTPASSKRIWAHHILHEMVDNFCQPDRIPVKDTGGKMSFGNKLRLLRKSKKVSLRDLSKKLHYDRYYLSRVENNAVNPSDELIKAAAKFFRVREKELRIA